MISPEDYCVLLELNDSWKWIARDNDTFLWVYEKKPIKYEISWDNLSGVCESLDSDSFQFIQWEDEEPYSIAELIEGYESEESKVKNLKEIRSEFENKLIQLMKGRHPMLKIGVLNAVSDLFNQLEEPEVLSEYWIEQKLIDTHIDTLSGDIHVTFRLDDLQNIIVPKQKLPMIPRFVAEWIEEMKQDERPLYSVMSSLMNKTNHEWAVWKSANKNFSEIVAQAWLDGFTVEEEPKYYALIKGHEKIGSDDKYWNYCITDESLDIGDNKVHTDVLAEYVLSATKDDWENLGINDDNADFVKVEEMEK